MTAILRILVVDDEAQARTHLRTLLAQCSGPAAVVAGEARDPVTAIALLQRQPIDLVMLDVQLPGIDGFALAQSLSEQPQPKPLIFVAAHAGHAARAFDLDAVDYLTKPVRLARLQQALQKAERCLGRSTTSLSGFLTIADRARQLRLPLTEVIYLKAELKYVTVRTAEKSYLLDASLSDLEQRYPGLFVRIHRNALVAPRALRALERAPCARGDEGWGLRLVGVDDVLAVSRRQLEVVREALSRVT